MFKKKEHAAPLIKMMSEMEEGECTLKEPEKEFSFSSTAITGVITRLEANLFFQKCRLC